MALHTLHFDTVEQFEALRGIIAVYRRIELDQADTDPTVQERIAATDALCAALAHPTLVTVHVYT